MRIVYADLHVHLGGIKMAASPDLTVAGILQECLVRKGVDMVGIIDASAPPALAQLQDLSAAGELVVQPGGGLSYQGEVTLILGSEVEVWYAGAEGRGAVHLLCYVPGLPELHEFAQWQARQVRNPGLSTQRHYCSADNVVRQVAGLGGFVIPAHVFTPHKSILAAAGAVAPVISPELWPQVAAVELGLSADTALAAGVPALAPFAFVANSDAHSRGKIAREYNALSIAGASFTELRLALAGREGRSVVAHYGLDPRLGKYHRSFCLTCEQRLEGDPPVTACPVSPRHRIVLGVLDRVHRLANLAALAAVAPAAGPTTQPAQAPPRPPYVHQIPLQFVPGLGARTLDRLLQACGSEMAVLHRVPVADLAAVVGAALAQRIDHARRGRLAIAAGAGGIYGRVLTT